MSNALTLFLVRHGESEWNAEGRLQGQTAHVPLTALGKEQADRTAARLVSSGAELVLSSDLLRASETGRIIADILSIPLRFESDLREQSLGIFEGKLAIDVRRETNDADWSDPQWRPPGGESLQDVYLRLEGLFARLRQDNSTGRIILVTHGDTARIALALLKGEGLDGVVRGVLKNGEFIEL